jgi:cell wall-associated NlpC family hydrolase
MLYVGNIHCRTGGGLANRYYSHHGYGLADNSRLRSPKCGKVENRQRSDVVGFAEGGGSYITHCGLYAGGGYVWHASSYHIMVCKARMDYITPMGRAAYAGARIYR